MLRQWYLLKVLVFTENSYIGTWLDYIISSFLKIIVSAQNILIHGLQGGKMEKRIWALESDKPEFEYRLFTRVLLIQNFLVSLSLSFLICKMGR